MTPNSTLNWWFCSLYSSAAQESTRTVPARTKAGIDHPFAKLNLNVDWAKLYTSAGEHARVQTSIDSALLCVQYWGQRTSPACPSTAREETLTVAEELSLSRLSLNATFTSHRIQGPSVSYTYLFTLRKRPSTELSLLNFHPESCTPFYRKQLWIRLNRIREGTTYNANWIFKNFFFKNPRH